MRKWLFFLLVLLLPPATAAPLTAYQNLTGEQRAQISNDGMFVKGIADTNWYALEVDPATGALPVTGTVVANNPSTGPTGLPVPADATYVGYDFAGNLVGATGTANGLKVDGSAVTQPISAAVLPLPTNASTSTKQPALGVAGTASTDVITVQGIAGMTALKVDGSAVTQPVSGTVATTQSTSPWIVGGGGTAGAAAAAVVTVQGIASMTPLLVNGSGSTQPVSGTVAVTQSTSPWVSNITQFGSSNVVTGTGAGGAGIPRMTVSSDSTIGLVAGSAIVGKVGIDQTTPGTTNAVSATNFPATVDVGTGLSGTSTQRTIGAGRDSTKTTLAYLLYSSTNVTTGAYVQLIASTTNQINRLCVQDTSGSVIKIATGAAASEVDRVYIPAGGFSTCIEINIPASTRVSLEALDTNATTGQIVITGLI